MKHIENHTSRFFFLYGQTKDEFYTSDLKIANLEEILHNHLQKNSYERIVYYQGQSKGVCCYDDKSFELSFKPSKSQEAKSVKKHKNNKVLNGVLGKRISKTPISSHVTFKNNKSLTKKMQDVDIVNHFNAFYQMKI